MGNETCLKRLRDEKIVIAFRIQCPQICTERPPREPDNIHLSAFVLKAVDPVFFGDGSTKLSKLRI